MHMQPVTVLVIADDAEATLMYAALAKRPNVRVMGAPDAPRATKLLEMQPAPALAIAGTAVLGKPADELVKSLEARGIPLIAVAAGLSRQAKKRALAAGVKEIHDWPADWPSYSELIEAVIQRFTQVD